MYLHLEVHLPRQALCNIIEQSIELLQLQFDGSWLFFQQSRGHAGTVWESITVMVTYKVTHSNMIER